MSLNTNFSLKIFDFVEDEINIVQEPTTSIPVENDLSSSLVIDSSLSSSILSIHLVISQSGNTSCVFPTLFALHITTGNDPNNSTIKNTTYTFPFSIPASSSTRELLTASVSLKSTANVSMLSLRLEELEESQAIDVEVQVFVADACQQRENDVQAYFDFHTYLDQEFEVEVRRFDQFSCSEQRVFEHDSMDDSLWVSQTTNTRKDDILKRFELSKQPSVLLNLTLLPEVDYFRYLGATPGFAEFPSPDQSFSAKKLMQFMSDNRGQELLRFAQKHSQLHGFGFLDFSSYLQGREAELLPHIVRNYLQDQELGRLFLESVFCSQLYQLTATSPSYMQLEEANSHTVFYVDHSRFCTIPRNEAKSFYSIPARAWFSLQNDVLMPFRIDLFCQEEWISYIPQMGSDWQVAKLILKCCSGQFHQLVDHALKCHFCIEPFAVALDQVVPNTHILFRLLRLHFRYTVDVNFKSRARLLNQGGLFDELVGIGGVGHMKLVQDYYQQEWSFFKDMCFPDQLENRSIHSVPGSFLYYHDGLRLWAALESYCQSVLEVAYPTEESFAADSVCLAFFTVLQQEAFATTKSNAVCFPVPRTRKECVKMVTGIIFTATAQHAAVGFPQFIHYSFVANSPLTLMKEPSLDRNKKDNETDELLLLQSFLPGMEVCAKTIATVWGLSRFCPGDEVFLLDKERPFFNSSLFLDPVFRKSCEVLKKQLEELEEDIVGRPISMLGTRYLWLQPSLIPTSVTT